MKIKKLLTVILSVILISVIFKIDVAAAFYTKAISYSDSEKILDIVLANEGQTAYSKGYYLFYNSTFAAAYNKTFPYPNYTNSVPNSFNTIFDNGTTYSITGSAGCMAYSNYVCKYVFGSNSIAASWKYICSTAGKMTADNVKDIITNHAQLGEQIRVDSTHSISFIAYDSNGFYYTDYSTDSNPKIYIHYTTWSNFSNECNKKNKTAWIYNTNINANTNTNISITSYPDKNIIADTNAILWGRVDKPSSYPVTKIGIRVRKDGSTYSNGWSKYEAPSWNYVGEPIVYPYYDLNAELGATLSPATKYLLQFYAVVNGTEYWSDEYYFTTTGSHSHNYPSSWTTVTAATCTSSGTAKIVCTSCGNTETKTLTALGHNYSSSYTIDKAATCTTAGSKSRHCTRCSSTTDVTTIPALGHDYYLDSEDTHPHKAYYRCDCGDYYYTGDKATLNSCSLCFPVGKSIVTIDKEQYDVGNSIEISWSEAERATHYNLSIHKKDSDGSYDTVVLREDSLTTNSYTARGLSEGEYRIYIYSYDSTRYMPDQSDWSHQESEPVDFKICTFARYYDWTFDFDNAMKMMSDAIISDGDFDLAVEEYNRGLVGTIDVYEDGVTNHLQEPNRPGYRFTEWKTLLKPNQSKYSVTYSHYIIQAQYEPLHFSNGECLYCDINFDNEIDIRDLINLKNIAVGIAENHISADLNSDDVIDAYDMSILRKFLLGTAKEKYINFDANGGNVDEIRRTVILGESLGVLPIPTRTGFNFDGWYTNDGKEITAETILSLDDITAIAHWSAKSYKVSWNTGTGYKTTVKRTSSPYADASIGTLNSGEIIYYGDLLTITYSVNTGYTLKSKGITTATVSGNITSSDIYATASVNSYTYKIVYKSSNGTSLGTATAEYNYGTTNTISPKSFTGYNTPSKQSVKWDSTSAKTITFTYTPTSVPTSQNLSSGVWGIEGSTEYLTYSVSAEYRNRTSNSIQVRVVWNNTLIPYYYYQRGQVFNATIGGKSTGNITIVPYNTWGSSVSYNRSLSGTSDWITIPISVTQTSISISADAYRQHSDGSLVNINESFTKTFKIPTY